MREIILVVEDDNDVRANITEILECHNYEVKSYGSAEEALKIFEAVNPDLVISDIKMPEMDGLQLLEILQNNLSYSHIPFIFLTAKADPRDIRKGMSFGADDYLIKPFRADELISSVRTRLEKKKKWQNEFEKIRESFALAVPHELRTPLIPILGFSDLILADIENMPKPEIRELVEKIKQSAIRLHERVEKFILLSSIEIEFSNRNNLEKLKKDSVKFPVEFIKKTVIEVGAKHFRKDDIKIEAEPVNAELQIPEFLLTRIIYELTENACKFSKSGTPINVIINPDANGLEFSTMNKGIGLTSSQIKRVGLFEHFENSTQLKAGSGVGLFTVKKITDVFNGKMTIESKPADYTKVTIALPFIK